MESMLNFKEKKLFLAFFIFLLLILLMGLVGIFQIQELMNEIEDLGKNNLTLESSVLEMRIKNASYAMGVRNYCYWRLSRYLGAVPMASGIDKIVSSGENFKQQLELYRKSAYSNEQKEWANQAQAAFEEVFVLGKKIIQLADQGQSGKISEEVNGLLMNFENRIYKIDDFLDNSMGKSNLEEVERQLVLARINKERSIFLLKVSLAAALVVGGLIVLTVYRRRIKERIYRRDMFNRMVNLEEDERKRLSNAVHDEMGQDLSALKIYLGVIQQGLANLSPDLQDKINQCREIIVRLLEKSHNIAFLLRPPDLDEVGLVESLEALLLEYQHLAGVDYHFVKPEGLFELSAEYSLLFYRITQELLTNMAKHSKAKHVELTLVKKPNYVVLTYRDDGRGFDYQTVMKLPLRRQEDKLKLGLLGLQERTQLLDGRMQINSGAGRGTNISVTLPL